MKLNHTVALLYEGVKTTSFISKYNFLINEVTFYGNKRSYLRRDIEMVKNILRNDNIIQDEVLLNDWLVACREEDVQKEPIQIVLMGERLVLFRNSKGIHAFKDLCCHRGAALSLGSVKNDCLVCHYHGWEYDESGKCVHIPQLPEDRPIPTQAKVKKYSCQEKYGFVWINIEGNEPKIFDLDIVEDESYHHTVWGPQKVHAKGPRVVENFLYFGHLGVIHDGYLGTHTDEEIGDYKVNHDNGRIYSDPIPIYQPDADGTGNAKYVDYTYEILSPYSVKLTKVEPDTEKVMTIMLSVRPIDEEWSVAYGLISFNYDNGNNTQENIEFQDMIFAQDKPVVQNQKPEELPLDLQVEMSLISDRMSIAYRKYLKKKGVKLGVE